MSPIKHLQTWLTEEQKAGAPNPQQAILSTCSKKAIPHGRVVAIREITEEGFLFFTQRETRKVNEMTDNPVAAITFWLELYQREVIIEGVIEPLADAENKLFWDAYPREAQIRFSAYAPTSAQPIESKIVLEEKKKQIALTYTDKKIPLNPFYCGFRLKPRRFIFYAYRLDELSDVLLYEHDGLAWRQQNLSP